MKKVIALDIGGTSMRVGVLKGKKISKYEKIKTPKKKLEFLKKLESLIKTRMDSSIQGIGIGVPSPVKEGVIKNAPNISLKNYNLKKHLQNKFKKRVIIKNDAGCVALAEQRLGCKKKNFIVLTIGTGIGGGIIINGKTYRGSSGMGAEFGHMYSGNKEIETLWKDVKKKMGKNLISELVKKRDKRSKEIVNEASLIIGREIASLVSALDPEVVILGGGAREAGKGLLKPIKKYAKMYSFLPKKTPIKWTKFSEAGLIGAGLLIN